MLMALKLAMPFTAFTVVTPDSVPLDGLLLNAMVIAPLKLLAVSLVIVRAVTCRDGAKATPATTVAGCTENASCEATAAVAVAVKVSGLPVSPAAVAVSDCAPGIAPSVHVTAASPVTPVFTDALETDPPDAVAKFTLTPLTPNPSAPVARTVTACDSAPPAGPVCALPLSTLSVVAFGCTVTVNVSAWPVGSRAITNAEPRLLRAAPVPTALICRRLVSELEKKICASVTS